MDALQTHPGRELLCRFAAGQLDESSSAEIERHLVQCDTCTTALESLPDDSLVCLLRGASDDPRASSTAEDRPRIPQAVTVTVAEGASTGGAGASPALPAVPAELADHPRYLVTHALGVGGMGAVCRAEHRLMERPVALKVMSRTLMDKPNAVERFRREFRAAARLSHSNIVGAYDAESVGGLHFLVMELVEGRSLARLVQERGPLPVAEAVGYIRQAAVGLQHAHEQGMVHRDIKPHNLMLTPGGVVKILDFGLARFARESGPAGDLTSPETVMGTPDYIAPEQARDSRSADIRADLYSLGGTFYFLLTGRPPFPEGDFMAKILAQAERQPTPLSQIRPDVPLGVVQIVERLMAKDPARRFQTPAELVAALDAGAAEGWLGQAGGPIEVKLAEPCRPDPQTATAVMTLDRACPPQPRRRKWRAAVVAALLLGPAGYVLGPPLIRIVTDQGVVEVQSEDPNVRVQVLQDGRVIRVIDPKGDSKVTLGSGTYELELVGGQDQARLDTEKLTVTRNGQRVVHVYLVPTETRGRSAATARSNEPPRPPGRPVAPMPPDVPKIVVRTESRPDLARLEKVHELVERAWAFQFKGSVDQFYRLSDEAVRLDETFAKAWYSRGTARYLRKDYADALADLNKALELDPKFDLAYNSRAITYSRLGQYARAVEDATRAISLNPRESLFYANRGWAYANLGDFERALRDYDQAITLSPTHAGQYWHRAAIHAKKGDTAKAEADRKTAVRLCPDLAREKLPTLPQRGPVATGPALGFEAFSRDFELTEQERELLEALNRERKAAGLQELRPNEGLFKAARRHAAAMARSQSLGHKVEDLDTSARVQFSGYSHDGFGEVIAGASKPAEAVERWLRSEGPRVILLHGTHRDIGLGLATGEDGVLYVSGLLATPAGPRPAGQAPEGAPRRSP
jgi:tetratricopeptide (TPR) repeat protein